MIAFKNVNYKKENAQMIAFKNVNYKKESKSSEGSGTIPLALKSFEN